MQVKERLRKMGHLQPINIFLRQEIDRMQKVITRVRLDLKDLKLAIDGTIIMSENLRDALDNMFDARVPTLWKKVGALLIESMFKVILIVLCKQRDLSIQLLYTTHYSITAIIL